MKWLFVIPIVFIALILGATLYLQPSNFRGCSDKPLENTSCGKADAIVVVSGGDTQARTAAGISLYKNGWADALIFSGAAYDKSGPSNADAMRSQALEAGVPAHAISVDEAAESTLQNAINTKSIFQQNNYHDVILVTSGYHQRRASLEFGKVADSVTIRNYPVTQDSDWGWYWWMTPKGWWLAGGELVKIIASYMGLTT